MVQSDDNQYIIRLNEEFMKFYRARVAEVEAKQSAGKQPLQEASKPRDISTRVA